MSLITRSVTTASILALVACSGTGPYGGPSQPPPPANEINATPSLAFKPGEITINPGESVTFAFGSVAHNIAFDAPVAGTPEDIPGTNSNRSVDRTFTASGTYRFHCTIHPAMTGSIIVR